MKLISGLLMTAAVLLGGCAGTSAIVKSAYRLAPGETIALEVAAPAGTSEEGIRILRNRLLAELRAHSLLAESAGPRVHALQVSITSYFMRHGAARAMAGAMAGTDNIQSTVRLRDAAGSILSEFTVESRNPTAWGSAGGLLEEHADKIVSTLRGAR